MSRKALPCAAVMSLALACSTAALASPWSLQIQDIDGSQGVTVRYTIGPGLLVASINMDGHQFDELARRPLTPAETARVAAAVEAFAGAGVHPLVEPGGDVHIADGDQIAVDFVSPSGHPGSVMMRNAFPAAFDALLGPIVPLVPRFRGMHLERPGIRRFAPRKASVPAAPSMPSAPRAPATSSTGPAGAVRRSCPRAGNRSRLRDG